MKFAALAKYFEKLEKTPSRNAMVEIIAELFSETKDGEAEEIAYLTQGRVAPSFEPVEFGMADKMVLRAVAKAYEEELDKVTDQFKKTGDLGKVAEALSGKARGNGLTVREVFLKLKLISETGGEGSVEKKIEILAELLREADPVSARYLARIPVNNLRLGFSDMTVLEGLSWMIDGTKKHKPIIEAAYNIRPDLGFIARTIKEGGGSLEKIKAVEPKIGTPILVMRAERLTTAAEILAKGEGKMAVEPKFDGFRVQIHLKRGVKEIIEKGAEAERETEKVKEKAGISQKNVAVELFSRGLEHVTHMYPDIVAAAEREMAASEAILDVEAIAYDPKTGKYKPFQETVQRKRKYDISKFAKDLPLRGIVFDCLYLDGESLIDKPYVERRRTVERILRSEAKNRTLVVAEMKVIERPEDLEKIFNETLKKGLEGIMAKRLDGVYQAGARGWNWIKLKGSYQSKLADTVDAVVMGIDFGQGKRNAFGVGAFLIGVYDQKTDTFKTISKVGTGLTDEEWRKLAESGKKLEVKEKPAVYDVRKEMSCDIWFKPEMVGVFIADEVTRSPMHTAGYALRFPRLQMWRTDKKPEDATSLAEIVRLVKIQKT